MTITYSGMPTSEAEKLWSGGRDAYDRAPERRTSETGGEPCRHCLGEVGKGEDFLVLAYRPFPHLQPYAETGPVFLHAKACPAHQQGAMPERVRRGEGQSILRGYGADDRIVYGTGTVVSVPAIEATAEAILGRDEVAYVHMRSATNNCYTLRIDRG